MPTLADLLYRLLPGGSSASKEPDWSQCPPWPPDLFAVTATLAQQTGCYAETRYSTPDSGSGFFTDSIREDLLEISRLWGETGRIPDERLQTKWDLLLRYQKRELYPSAKLPKLFKDAIMSLLVVADEASIGMGWVAEENLPLADFVYSEHRHLAQGKPHLLQLPESLCMLVPKAELCVQPKTCTPQSGCTIRSFSHHLSLLPTAGSVATHWLFGPYDEDPEPEVAAENQKTPQDAFPLNLLLIPFPYTIHGTAFVTDEGGTRQRPFSNFFKIDPRRWMDGVSVEELHRFLLNLIEKAEKEAGEVHGIVFPEAALDRETAVTLAEKLARGTTLEVFIAGVIDTPQPDSKQSLPRNSVYGALFDRKKQALYSWWEQAKHHRWSLDRAQIQQYQLGHVLDPSCRWWEQISIAERRCVFYTFRHGASLTVLVCEDLARIDPVQAVIRAVGPNLVVALLMDGAQYTWRWSGRYATVLAEDPGSSVLTLTSTGMLRRSVRPGDQEPMQVGLWKQPGGPTQELLLPKGDHALLLTLCTHHERHWSLDGRHDHEMTMRLSLSGVRSVRADSPEVEKMKLDS